ncbi:MAG: hypothetical protein WB616_23430, partial [Candidatus Sulfotelmatobacter sp.]
GSQHGIFTCGTWFTTIAEVSRLRLLVPSILPGTYSQTGSRIPTWFDVLTVVLRRDSFVVPICHNLFMVRPEELRSLPAWKVHTLTGDRKGTWSLSVSNRRLTFRIDIAEREICDLNLEDYH